MYSAFYVVRSRCANHSWHVDYQGPVGTHALTLLTPLRDFDETGSFQLSYRSRPPRAAGAADVPFGEGGGADEGVRRYVYRRGRAVVFGAGFEHSTEPGAGRDGQAHVYLCFTFGTDRQERWREISRTLGTQSRVVQHPDGALRLSNLGEQIEEALAAL